MNATLIRPSHPLLGDSLTMRKLEINFRKNKEQDHSAAIDAAAAAFRYEDCRDHYWNPENYSLLHGTPLWDQASPSQKILLNQLYWVAYYSQIISAEIATILLNQTSAAGLYTMEDFRLICDTLDLETAQERAHINAFKTVGEQVEAELFGERLFTYPMRSLYAETMIFRDSSAIQKFWRNIQLRFYTQLSAGNAFIGCQYFAVRGLRTLNGKMIQQGLAQVTLRSPRPQETPLPSQISANHFLDESFHFNSSKVLTHDVIRSLKAPTAFERWVANKALAGCQADHLRFTPVIKGIFWQDAALFPVIEKILLSRHFGFDRDGAREMMRLCFTEESAGLHESHKIHQTALESYKAYLAPLDYASAYNKEMRLMSTMSLERALQENRAAFAGYCSRMN